jgi:hypothetical protein
VLSKRYCLSRNEDTRSSASEKGSIQNRKAQIRIASVEERMPRRIFQVEERTQETLASTKERMYRRIATRKGRVLYRTACMGGRKRKRNSPHEDTARTPPTYTVGRIQWSACILRVHDLGWTPSLSKCIFSTYFVY